MESITDETLILDESHPISRLLLSVMNNQNNLIVLLHKHVPILFNKAFLQFMNLRSSKEFLREFGSMLNRFVPHDDYFHAGKVHNIEEWTESLFDLPENERIVSMLNYRIEPHAFSMHIDAPLPDYSIITFIDISQELIERIMTENDASIEKESGAFERDYFLHMSKSFHEAAQFNKKQVALTIIELMDNEIDIYEFVQNIKHCIRQSDMLVRWGKKSFLLAYLVESNESTQKFTQKIQANTLYAISLITVVQKKQENIKTLIAEAEEKLKNRA